MLFHCLFCHMYTRKGRDKGYWDLSCDIAMEYVIDGLYQKCVHVPRSALRREMYLRLEKALAEKGHVLTAERVYRALLEMELPERRLDMLKAEFFVDSLICGSRRTAPRSPGPGRMSGMITGRRCRRSWKPVQRMRLRITGACWRKCGWKTGRDTTTAGFCKSLRF